MFILYWRIISSAKGSYATGEVFGNPNFEDGTEIHTSTIQSTETLKDALIIHTRNSIYRLPLDSKANW